ncbi:uncharacterized protein LOC115878624 [Sitophilus oryzae]|uniref:Uncharacterized protein LOC115878624 n=1 Tax=Sitophilus oryzae TaxID=7048 RepID=A0A6J2XJD6_SITOR|nr:uncharacterized protein LOC115878624 [Sitophilus oryzae]
MAARAVAPQEPPRSSPQQDSMAVVAGVGATTFTPTETPTTKEPYTEEDIPVDYPQTSSTVRGVEIGIVLLVLVVWIGAIALFFNRWGKIRMLLPYQPDYKQEQLKVPGTAACAAAVAAGNTCTHHPTTNICQQCKKKKRERLRLLSRPQPITGPICTCYLSKNDKNGMEMAGGYIADIDSD